ncbi:MAG: enoyl-CoA hydratase-related protein [Chthoniobacterales bacterium]
MSESRKIALSFEAFVAEIVLDRPEKLNALDPDMLGQLGEAVTEVEENSAIRVVVLRANGDRAFCVGADIYAWSALSPLQMWSEWIRRGHRIFEQLATLRQPVICAVNGLAFGGGLELALAADIRLAANDASFAMPEVKLGTVPGWGGTKRLPELIGASRAKQLIFSGAPISAQIAERWGLVNEIVPRADLFDHMRALAKLIAANAPIAVQTAKQSIHAGLSGADAQTTESLASAVNAATNDAREGMNAFRAKRSPEFKNG